MSVNQDAWREGELKDMGSCDIDAPVLINISDADNMNFDMVEDIIEVDEYVDEGTRAVGRPKKGTSNAGRQAKIYQALDILKLKNPRRTVAGTLMKSSDCNDVTSANKIIVSPALNTSKKAFISGRVVTVQC